MGLFRIIRPRVERGFLLLWLVLAVLAAALGWFAKLPLPAILALLVVVSLVHILSQWMMAVDG